MRKLSLEYCSKPGLHERERVPSMCRKRRLIDAKSKTQVVGSDLASHLVDPAMTHQNLVDITCFICEDSSRPLYNVCACQMFVHEHCYLRLLSVPSHSTHCAVCRHPYDLRVTKKLRLRWNAPLSSCIAAYIAMMGTIAIASFYVAMTSDELVHVTIFGALSAVTTLFIVFLSWTHRSRTSRCVCCGIRRVIVRKTVNLPAPLSFTVAPLSSTR